MAYPSLKKMGKARARREGNYASSNCPSSEDITNLELGLTLLTGSQTQRGVSSILEQVVSKGGRAPSKNDSNQEQDGWSRIGHRNEPRPSRITSPSLARNSQRRSQALVRSAVTHGSDEENEVGNHGALSRNSSFAAQAGDAEINITSCRRLSSPFVLNLSENDRTDEIGDGGHKVIDGRRNYSYLRRSRERQKIEHRAHPKHSSRSYVNRSYQIRENPIHSGEFQVLGYLDICKNEFFNDVDVPLLLISAVHPPKPHHDRVEKLLPCALSTGSENKGINVERLGQNGTAKTRWQSGRYWRGIGSKAHDWNTMDGGEGSKVEMNDGSDGLKSGSVSSSRRYETYVIDSFDGSSSPEPVSAHGGTVTYSTETGSNAVKVSTKLLGRESTLSVLGRRNWRCSDDGTHLASEGSLKSVGPKQPGGFGTCLPSASHHPNVNPNVIPKEERRNPRTLVPGSKCGHNCDDEKLLLSSSSSSSLHHILTAPTVPFKFNLPRRASISTTTLQTSHRFPLPHILGDSRTRSSSLPCLRFIKSSSAMDYSQITRSSRPARVSRFVDTFPRNDTVHQSNSMDVAYAHSVDEVKRLKTRVQELERDNSGLIENANRCHWEMNEMRMHFEQRYREVLEIVQSKTEELEDQKAETQLWRHRTEQLDTLSRQHGPKRSSAATVFETLGRFSPEANFISQPILPYTGAVVAGAIETNTDVQFITDAQSSLVSPRAAPQAPAAPTEARAVPNSTGTSAATSIDLTTDESLGTNSISPLSSASPSRGPSSEAQSLCPVASLYQRIKNGAKWMGEAHPSKRVKGPETNGPIMEQAKKRICLDPELSAQRAPTIVVETAMEKKRAGRKAYRAKVKASAVQRKQEQEQRDSNRSRELEREAKLWDDEKRRQDLVGVEKAVREAKLAAEKERAWKRREQQSRLLLQEEALEAPSNDEDSLADLFEASEDDEFFQADEGQVDGEGKEEDDGLRAELDAAIAEEARGDDGLEAELDAALAEEEERALKRVERDGRKG